MARLTAELREQIRRARHEQAKKRTGPGRRVTPYALRMLEAEADRPSKYAQLTPPPPEPPCSFCGTNDCEEHRDLTAANCDPGKRVDPGEA